MEEKNAVTYGSLRLLLGDVMLPVINLNIEEFPNQHGSLSITIMVEEQIKNYLLYEGEGAVSLFYLEEGSMKPLFQGIVIWMKAEAVGDTYYIYLDAITDSYLMDFSVGNLSFQDVNMTLHQLIQKLMGMFQGSQVLLAIPDQIRARITVQYQETIWEFLKRILSQYESYVFVDSTSRGIRLRIGLPEVTEKVDWDHLSYRIHRNTAPKQINTQLKDQMVYQVETYDVLPLGTKVNFHNQELYIGQITRSIKGGLLVNQYQLYFKEGLRIKEYYNPLLSGVSINGVVMGIQRNKVQVKMITDALSSYQKQYEFPFSTVAASADGSGWYCMPKKGDEVRIFFPVSDEKEAYAIANIQGNAKPSQNDPTSNPNLKDITSPDGKTVKFIANGILLSVGEGKGTVTLTNDGKAEIKTEEDMEICAAEEVYIATDKELKLSAGVKIQFISDAGSSISITEDTVLANASIIINN